MEAGLPHQPTPPCSSNTTTTTSISHSAIVRLVTQPSWVPHWWPSGQDRGGPANCVLSRPVTTAAAPPRTGSTHKLRGPILQQQLQTAPILLSLSCVTLALATVVLWLSLSPSICPSQITPIMSPTHQSQNNSKSV